MPAIGLKSVAPDSGLSCPLLSHRISQAGAFNLYQAAEGEQLPSGYGRNYHRLLMRHLTQILALDLNVIQHKATRLHDHTVIASFTGKKIPTSSIADWIQLINKKLGFLGASFKMDMGRGFLFLSTANAQATRKLLALTPHSTPWKNCVYQERTPDFDPDCPTGLFVPAWISLVKLPYDFKPVEGLIAASLG